MVEDSFVCAESELTSHNIRKILWGSNHPQKGHTQILPPSLFRNEDLFSYPANKTIKWKEEKETLNKYSPQS